MSLGYFTDPEFAEYSTEDIARVLKNNPAFSEYDEALLTKFGEQERARVKAEELEASRNTGFGGDLVDMVQSGMYEAVGGLAETANQATSFLDDTPLDFGASESVREWAKENAEAQYDTLTLESLESLQKSIFETEDGDIMPSGFGEGATDLRTLGLQAAKMVAMTIGPIPVGVGLTSVARAGLGLNKLAKAGLKAGQIDGVPVKTLSEARQLVAQSNKAKDWAATTLGFGGTEGAIAGGVTANSVRDQILAASEEELQNSDRYRELLLSHSPEEAKRLLAEEEATDAFLITAPVTAMMGAGAGRFWDASLEKTIRGESRLGNAGRGFVAEALQESPQSFAENTAQNLSLQEIDPDRGTFEGSGTAALEGGAFGGFLGGGVGLMTPVKRIGDKDDVDEAIEEALNADGHEFIAEAEQAMSQIEVQTDLLGTGDAPAGAGLNFGADVNPVTGREETLDTVAAGEEMIRDVNLEVGIEDLQDQVGDLTDFAVDTERELDTRPIPTAVDDRAPRNASEKREQVQRDKELETLSKELNDRLEADQNAPETIREARRRLMDEWDADIRRGMATPSKPTNPAMAEALEKVGLITKQQARDNEVPLFSAAAQTMDQYEAVADGAATAPTNDRTEPTDAQREAGNYAKPLIRPQGLDVRIENPEGSVRRGTNRAGESWENTTTQDYGYFRGTKGSDGDQIDVFLGPRRNDPKAPVFVIDQVDPATGRPDEKKVMLGYSSEQEAVDAYLSNYPEGWEGLGGVSRTNSKGLKRWLKTGKGLPPVDTRERKASEDVERYQRTAGEKRKANEERQAKVDEAKARRKKQLEERDAKSKTSTEQREAKTPKSKAEKERQTARARKLADKRKDQRKTLEKVESKLDLEKGSLKVAPAPRTLKAFIDNFVVGVLNKQVIFYEGPKGVPDGMIDPSQPGIIFINRNADKPHMTVLGHELLHSLKRDDRAAYEDLRSVLEPMLRDHSKYADWVNSARQQQGLDPVENEIVIEELIADLMGDSFTSPEFWQNVENRAPGLAARLASIVRNWIDGILEAVGYQNRATEGSPYFKDFAAARDAAADYLADRASAMMLPSDVAVEVDYTVAETGETVTVAEEGDIILNSVNDRLDSLNSLLRCLRK